MDEWEGPFPSPFVSSHFNVRGFLVSVGVAIRLIRPDVNKFWRIAMREITSGGQNESQSCTFAYLVFLIIATKICVSLRRCQIFFVHPHPTLPQPLSEQQKPPTNLFLHCDREIVLFISQQPTCIGRRLPVTHRSSLFSHAISIRKEQSLSRVNK